MAYQLLGRYEEAIAALKKVVLHAPDHPGVHLILAVSYSEVGREAEARAEAAEVLRIKPDYSLEVLRQRMPSKIQRSSSAFLPPCARRGWNECSMKQAAENAKDAPERATHDTKKGGIPHGTRPERHPVI